MEVRCTNVLTNFSLEMLLMSTHNKYFHGQIRKTLLGYHILSAKSLTHCRLNDIPHTIYWKILIWILGMSGYVI